MKRRDLNGAWCIKDQRVIVKEDHIKERWKSYFDKLFNGNHMKNWSDLGDPMEDKNNRFVWRIRMTEVKDALRRMKMGKLGLEEIPSEVWKCLGDVGVWWLTNQFNKILSIHKMPSEWRRSTQIPIYKNKGVLQNVQIIVK